MLVSRLVRQNGYNTASTTHIYPYGNYQQNRRIVFNFSRVFLYRVVFGTKITDLQDISIDDSLK